MLRPSATLQPDLFLCSSDTLISPSGKILVPGIREAVAPLTDEEWKLYQDIEFDMDDYKNKIGVGQLMYNNKVILTNLNVKNVKSKLMERDIRFFCPCVFYRWMCCPTGGVTPPFLSMALRAPFPTPAQKQSFLLRLLRSSPLDRFPTWTLLWSKNRYK